MAKATFTVGSVTLSFTVPTQAAADISAYAQSMYPQQPPDAAASVKWLLRWVMQNLAEDVRRWKDETAAKAITPAAPIPFTEDGA